MKQKAKLRPFVPMFVDTMNSPAWLSMSAGARLLYLSLKKRYNRKEQKAVYLSTRVAAKELKAHKDTVSRRYHELQHYGFITEIQKASFGPGRGRAALYRLADEPYLGHPPSMEFTYWNGCPFEPQPNIFRPFKQDRVSLRLGQSRPLKSDGSIAKHQDFNKTRLSGLKGHI